ncbi:unnamed protein product, partial [Iphiclides podalirius]
MYILYFIQFAVLSATASVIFEDCGSAYDLHRVNILGCGMRLPCYITLGDSVPVTMEFYADFVSRQLDQDVTININFISSRTHVTPDPCATVHCPVNSDEVTSFTSVMSVPTNVAVNQRGFLQWRVYNEHNRLFVSRHPPHNMLLLSLVVLSVLALAAPTEVQQCSDQPNTVVESNVQLRPCKKLPCRLKKGTDQHINIEFTPDTDIEEITNKVWANVYGVDLPFFGVDGNSICNKLFTESGDKSPCPLKAGNKYVYKDSFPVLSLYPTIKVNVRWALQVNKKDIVCFEVPANIVN